MARLTESRETGVSDRVRNEYLHTESNLLGRHNACFPVPQLVYQYAELLAYNSRG